MTHPNFRSTSTFTGFNGVFTGNATAIVPMSLYAAGLISKDSKMKGTALLAGEAVADSEILTFVHEGCLRTRPTSFNVAYIEFFGYVVRESWRGAMAIISGFHK